MKQHLSKKRIARSAMACAIMAALCGAMTSAAIGAEAMVASDTKEVRRYVIAAGPLNAALQQFSAISGGTVNAPESMLTGRQANAVSGNLSADAALQTLLQGTGLVARKDGVGKWLLTAATSGKSEPSGVAGDETKLPEVIVVGTGLKTEPRTYPGSVSVIETDKLANRRSVIEAMADLPGVTTGGDSGRVTGEQFNIRGFGYQSEGRVIILQDGVRRSASLYSNHISTFRSDSDLLKRVEVVKGASSVHHGGGAIGGVVAMTTKDATDFLPAGKDLGIAAKLRYEDNNYSEGYLAGALVPKDQPYELLVYGKKGRAGDMRMSRNFSTDANGKGIDTVDNEEDLRVAFVQVAFKPAPGHRLSISHYDYKLNNETTWQTLYHTNYSTTTGPVVGELLQGDTVAKYRYKDPGNAWIDLSAMVYHSASSYDRGYEYIDTKTKKPTDLDYKNSDKRDGVRLSNESHFETGTVPHRLVLGLDHEKRKEDATYVLNGVNTVFGSMPNTYKDTGAYFHLESSFWMDTLVTQLGGRYDWFDRSVDANKGSYRDTHFSPRVGASLRVSDGWHLLANWSEAFRAPTPHETSSEGPLNPHYWYLPNPDLRPETIRESELGFSYEKKAMFSTGDRFYAKLMHFDGNVEDMITFGTTRNNETSPQNSPYGTYQNIANAVRHGVELQASYDWDVGGVSINYSTLKQKDETTGKNTPQTFADKFGIDGYFRPFAGWKVGGNITHWFKPSPNPASMISSGKTYWYVRKDYTIANAYAEWQPNVQGSGLLGRDFTMRLGVNNIFDAPYLNARDVETTSRVGKGRNFFLSVETRF